MVPSLRLSINPLLRAAAVTFTLVPGQTRTSPPRSSRKLAAVRPAATAEPLATRVPPAAMITEPLTLASVANTSPIAPSVDCCARSWAQRPHAANNTAASLLMDMKCNDTAELCREESDCKLGLGLKIILLDGRRDAHLVATGCLRHAHHTSLAADDDVVSQRDLE